MDRSIVLLSAHTISIDRLIGRDHVHGFRRSVADQNKKHTRFFWPAWTFFYYYFIISLFFPIQYFKFIYLHLVPSTSLKQQQASDLTTMTSVLDLDAPDAPPAQRPAPCYRCSLRRLHE